MAFRNGKTSCSLCDTGGSTPGSGDMLFADFRTHVALGGALGGGNRTFTTPDAFHHDGAKLATVRVYHNRTRLDQTASTNPNDGDYYVSESGGIGTGYDTINLLRFTPNPNSVLRADYWVA